MVRNEYLHNKVVLEVKQQIAVSHVCHTAFVALRVCPWRALSFVYTGENTLLIVTATIHW